MCLKSKCCIMGRLGVFFILQLWIFFICEPEKEVRPSRDRRKRDMKAVFLILETTVALFMLQNFPSYNHPFFSLFVD